jgi:hypothetical protein
MNERVAGQGNMSDVVGGRKLTELGYTGLRSIPPDPRVPLLGGPPAGRLVP